MENSDFKFMANQEPQPQDNINIDIVNDWVDLFELLLPAYIKEQEKDVNKCK